jgi:hypothetical protein
VIKICEDDEVGGIKGNDKIIWGLKGTELSQDY